MAAYTERVLWLCAADFTAVYAVYRLWYVTPDVIAFPRELDVGMSVPFGSRTNVCECLELFEVVESTPFEQWP